MGGSLAVAEEGRSRTVSGSCDRAYGFATVGGVANLKFRSARQKGGGQYFEVPNHSRSKPN